MNKILLLMMIALASVCTKAQAIYDELDLLGTWEITERTGTTPVMEILEEDIDEPIVFLYFGTATEESHPQWVTSSTRVWGGLLANVNPDGPRNGHHYMCMSDFFISNNDKLHISLEESAWSSFRFVIESMTKSTMKLRSFDNQMRLTLKHVSTPDFVGLSEVRASNPLPNGIYTLNGTRVNNPEKGIYIVKTDTDTSKRVIK